MPPMIACAAGVLVASRASVAVATPAAAAMDVRDVVVAGEGRRTDEGKESLMGVELLFRAECGAEQVSLVWYAIAADRGSRIADRGSRIADRGVPDGQTRAR
ncbi:hypothetical protein GCM10010277_75730 [Streptomyces longisporoflavus]|nr:hypothetical protein GCM10010277_75730 [Streptomyces longisporoflavus]